MEGDLSLTASFPSTPAAEALPLTVSPAQTSLNNSVKIEEIEVKTEKKPAKKRRSWGQELPIPKTNLPPRKRAKTEDEKEQRRIERVLRNRAAAQTSRERKRLEMEKLEGEKIKIEEQNQILLQRLSQMEAENDRLNRQIAQLTTEIRGSRGNTPKSLPSSAGSPTLTPCLFKQEGDDDDFPSDRLPFPTPPPSNYALTLKPSTLAEPSDATQHPAAMLCDLQCPSQGSKELEMSCKSMGSVAESLRFQMMLQLLFQMTTFVAYSAVVHPLGQILQSLKTGLPLMFSTEEIFRHLPLILWLISTPSSSPSTAFCRPPALRTRLLTRLLACSPALARPLRDATGRALQLAVSDSFSASPGSTENNVTGKETMVSLLTLAWAIDDLRPDRRVDIRERKIYGRLRSRRCSRSSEGPRGSSSDGRSRYHATGKHS